MRISTTTECAQSAIVEALHDGRLGPQEVASIERHIAVCAACAAHRQVLVAIRTHVRVPPRPANGLANGEVELTPLAPLPLAGFELTTRVIQRRGLRVSSDGSPIRKFALALGFRHHLAGMVGFVVSRGGRHKNGLRHFLFEFLELQWPVVQR